MSRRIPREVPLPSPWFTNHETVVGKVIESARHATDRDGPKIRVLFGPPGVGVTATALMLAERLRESYPDGSLFVRLMSGEGDHADQETRILRDLLLSLGVDRSDVPDRVDARAGLFRTVTTGLRLLVVVDGAMTAAQVRMFLPGAGASLVIVTERRPLRALQAGEAAEFFDLAPLGPSAARELIGRIIGADRMAAEPDAVDEIIGFCDGLPVALCVAGAMIARQAERRANPAARTVRDLRDEHRRLAVLSRDDDLSVRAVFSAAYHRLGAIAQKCYRALGARPATGEIGLTAIASATALDMDDARDAMDELVDASLVEEQSDDRYAVREFVRLHAASILPNDEHDTVASLLLWHYLNGAVSAGALVAPRRPWWNSLYHDWPIPAVHENAAAAWAWLEQERGNIAAALDYASAVAEYEPVGQWCVALWPLYESGKYYDDLLSTHELGVDAATRLGNKRLRSLLWSQIGFAHQFRHDHDKAVDAFQQAIVDATDEADRELEATAVEGLGLATAAQGHRDDAIALLRRNLRLAEEIGDPRRIALAKFHLAKVEHHDAALLLLHEAMTPFVTDKDDINIAKTHTWRGKRLIDAGRWTEARSSLDQALATMTGLRRRFDQAEVLTALGDLCVAENDIPAAKTFYREALAIYDTWRFTARAEQLRHQIDRLSKGD